MELPGLMKSKLMPVLLAVVVYSCNQPTNKNKQANNNSQQTKTTSVKPIAVPSFNADSAYKYVKKQVDFGPRIPGTKAHKECGAYLIKKLRHDSLDVIVQHGTVTTYNKKKFRLENIIASYKPNTNDRILLCAHWDTRPFADLDSINPWKPFDGADDGGSGVAVLLELARQIHLHHPHIGVDLIFFDIEDYGQPDHSGYPEQQDTWCLGSQYWAKHPHRPNYTAKFGILLDMVGAKNAVFPMEGTSMYYAPQIVKKVWNIADEMGYSSYFTRDVTGQTTDDHYYINELTGIPTIDVVHFIVSKGDYPYFHHHHSDNMSIIDPTTLKVVGQTMLQVIYTEK